MSHFSSLFLHRRALLALAPAAVGASLLPMRASASDAPAAIAPLVDKFVADGKSDGLSVAVVHAGATHYYNAGVISQTSRAPASERSIYEIASISKTFTALILAHAVREGRVRLTDPVQRYLPAGYTNLARNGRAITFADIVTTTSALPDNIPDWSGAIRDVPPAQATFIAAKMLAEYPPSAFLPDLAKVSLVDIPGAVPRHSNAASVLLGVLLERIYNQPYPALLSRYVETPLGMRAGTGEVPVALLVSGYGTEGGARPPLNQRALLAAAGLRYSASDMARYLVAQIAQRDSAIALTHQPLFGTPESGGIGFHWNIAKKPDSQLYYRHSGGAFGCSSYCDFYPAQGYGIVLLANRSGPTLQDELKAIADATHDAIFGPPKGLKALEAALEASDYADVSASIAQARRDFPELHLDEGLVNSWGYRLLRSSRAKAALGIFAYNAAAHPESWNVHDSYGEALAAIGDRPGAIRAYRRALTLNPGNDNAAKVLTQLERGK